MTEHVEPTCPGTVYLSEISPKDKPWDTHAVEAGVVSNAYKQGSLKRLGDKIDSCGKGLDFGIWLKLSTEEKTYRLRKAFFCRVRYCPRCQWRKQLMWRARIFQALPKIMRDYPDATFLFLTLTVRVCKVEDLRETLELMNLGWKRLIQRRDFPALGAFKCTEVTRSKQGMAHPHFHVILMVNPEYFSHGYISQKKWRANWADCARLDYDPVVNIKAVKGRLGQSNDPNSEVFEAILETFKYSTKPSDLMADPKWLETLTLQTFKTRAISVSGVFKKYMSSREPEDLVGEIETPKDDEVLIGSAYFKWQKEVQRYIQVDVENYVKSISEY
jgi:plasmid rolling circle replication initiator protein Rep